jgi:hypothetical protein
MASQFPPGYDQPIPNNPFYSPDSNYIRGEYGPFIAGSGIFIDNSTGTISAGGSGPGGISAILPGSGILVSPNVGGIVTVSNTGVLNLLAGNGINITNVGGAYTITNTAPASGPTGTVTQVNTGAGLTGGPIISTGTIALTTTGVAPGTYSNPTITVDSYGRISFASPGTPSGALGILATSPLQVTTGVFPQTVSISPASTSASGAVQLNDTVTSTSTSQAATPRAVKETYDLASAASTSAATALTSATTAVSTANNALGIANTAQTCALQALTNAAIAQGDATQALSDAANAQSSANTALTTATGSQTTANAALSSANNRIPCSAYILQGDLLSGDGSGSFIRHPTGADGSVLLACTAAASGLCWSTILPSSSLPVATGTISGTVFGSTDGTTYYSSAIGICALNPAATGYFNEAFGSFALECLTTGSYNVGLGTGSLGRTTCGDSNVAVGRSAMFLNTTGGWNTAVGTYALCQHNSGRYNIGIGYNVQTSSPSVCSEVNLYNSAVTARFQGAATGWSFVSDERDKANVRDLALGLPFVEGLTPREFEWSIRGSDVDKGKSSAGFVAQEVDEIVNAHNAHQLNLVDKNDNNRYTLATTNLIPVLVKAIQELSGKVNELEAKLAGNG